MAKATCPANPSRKHYARLAPRVKTLKEGTIRKKWRKLPVATQVKVTDLLRTVERPATTHQSNDRRHVEVQATISELIAGLIQRLPRMPFPPGTDESSFDFEYTVNRHRVLEEQLSANTHTIGLVGAEVKEETDLLEQERAQLEALERDLADLGGPDRKHEQRLHPFARGSGLGTPLRVAGDYETRSAIKVPASMLGDLEQDPEAKDILDQLRHHLDSMQNNIEDTKDIVAALATSQAALDVFNWRRLGKTEYRRVYGVDAT